MSKRYIYHKLSLLRDKEIVPEPLVKIIDWIRYEILWEDDNLYEL